MVISTEFNTITLVEGYVGASGIYGFSLMHGNMTRPRVPIGHILDEAFLRRSNIQHAQTQSLYYLLWFYSTFSMREALGFA